MALVNVRSRTNMEQSTVLALCPLPRPSALSAYNAYICRIALMKAKDKVSANSRCVFTWRQVRRTGDGAGVGV